MNPAEIEAVLSGQRTDVRAVGLRLLLGCVSPVYGCVAILNRAKYDWNLAAVHRVNAPVISVGNITTGGTGKTPLTAWLVHTLQRLDKKPGIASRGYKSLGDTYSSSPEHGGCENDEKLVLEQLCPGTLHLQNRNRVSAAGELVENHGCDCVILDDGFQHRRLHRDLDIVLIDAVNPFGYGHLLPRGLLREPLSSLRRADLLVITRTEQVSPAQIQHIREYLALHLKQRNTPTVEVAFEPTAFLDQQGKRSPLSERSLSAVMFCGIGNPSGFQKLVQGMDYEVRAGKNFFVFPDHHHYTKQEVQTLCETARKIGANELLTTQKDLVKLVDILPPEITCKAICIEAVIKSGEEMLLQKLRELFPMPSR